MEKVTWRAVIKEGMVKEYIKRHDEIWPEMVETLKAAGICNYTIWLDGNSLFGYYECEKGQNTPWIIRRKAKLSNVGIFPWIRSCPCSTVNRKRYSN